MRLLKGSLFLLRRKANRMMVITLCHILMEFVGGFMTERCMVEF